MDHHAPHGEPTTPALPEQAIWTGRSSQWKNLWAFVSCLLLVPIPWAAWRWLVVRQRVFRLTTERLMIDSGVLNRSTEALELYRVRDWRIVQSFWMRMVGLQHVVLSTSDTTTPEVVVDFVRADLKLPDLMRHYVEECRQRKRVREIDIE